MYKSVAAAVLAVLDHRLLADGIDGEDDLVPDTEASISTAPVLPSRTNGIATSVLRALPCAPRLGEM